MTELKGSSTEKDLREAFAGEAQANRTYLAYAERAEREGHSQIAKLFRAVAEGETVHALAHLAALGEVGTTQENLRGAIEGETHEVDSMYPPMIERAQAAGFRQAQRSFSRAKRVEEVHARLFQEASEDLAALPAVDYYVCPVCGYVADSEPPTRCPICGTAGERFRRIDYAGDAGPTFALSLGLLAAGYHHPGGASLVIDGNHN